MRKVIKLLSSIGLLSVLSFNPSLINETKEVKGLEVRDVLEETFTNEATGRKVTPKRAGENTTVTTPRVQQKKNDDGFYSMRVLAGISSINVDTAGFYISVAKTEVRKEVKCDVTKAYTAAIVNGETKSAQELFGTEFLIAFVVSGIEDVNLNNSYVVTPFYGLDSKEVKGGAREYAIDNYTDLLEGVTADNFSTPADAAKSYNSDDNSVSFTFTSSGAGNRWDKQSVYKYFALVKGKKYTVSAKIKSSVSRKIEIIAQYNSGDWYGACNVDQTIELVKDQEYMFNFNFEATDTNSCLLGFMLGNVDGVAYENQTITIINPQLRLRESRKTCTVEFDANGGTMPSSYNNSFVVGKFFKELPTPTKDGHDFLGWFDGDRKITSESIVEDGEGLRLVARWRDTTSYKVDEFNAPMNVKEGGEGNAAADLGNLYYWRDGSFKDISVAWNNNGIDVSFTKVGGAWYGLQLFYYQLGLDGISTYKISFNLNSSVETKITVCGVVVPLKVGDNQISVNLRGFAAGKTPFDFQFGTNEGNYLSESGTYRFENFELTKLA